MGDDKKSDLNYDDWDSLPLAPDDDWDDIPLPAVDPSSTFVEEKAAEKTTKTDNGLSVQKPNQIRPKEEFPVHINVARSGKAPAAVDDNLEGILADEGGLNEDFDDLVDVSADEVDDIDVGSVTALPDEAFGVASPLTADLSAAVSPPARPLVGDAVPKPAQPEQVSSMALAVAGDDGANDIATASNDVSGFDAHAFENMGLIDHGDVEVDEPPQSFDAHLRDELEGAAQEEPPAPPKKNEGGKTVEGAISKPPASAEDADSSKSSGRAADEASSLPPPPEGEGGPMPSSLSSDLQDIATQKVELDIDGIFLDESPADSKPDEGLKREDEASANEPEEKPEAEEAPTPVEEPSQIPVSHPGADSDSPPKGLKAVLARLKALPGSLKGIPKKKLLIIVAPVLLVLTALSFGAYKLFFAGGDEATPLMAIDPAVPPRAAEPGTLDLGPFYLSFPGEAGAAETIVEITFAIHYNDISDKAVLESRMPAVRDMVFRLASAKGSQVAASGEAQRELRDDLLSQLNEVAGGGNHLDYVQIVQVRILR